MSSTDLTALAAHHEIDRVLKRYCRAMDRIDAALGYSVWHDDGLADYGPIFRGTGRAFVDWVCDFHRTLEGQSHQIANTLIELRGDRAGSETYVTAALLFRAAGRHRVTTSRGRYLDEWSCRGGLWAIDRRRFVLDFAFTEDVEAREGWGTRDAGDPSYALLGAAGGA